MVGAGIGQSVQTASAEQKCGCWVDGGPGSLGNRLVHGTVFSQTRGKCNTQVLPSIPHLFSMN